MFLALVMDAAQAMYNSDCITVYEGSKEDFKKLKAKLDNNELNNMLQQQYNEHNLSDAYAKALNEMDNNEAVEFTQFATDEAEETWEYAIAFGQTVDSAITAAMCLNTFKHIKL